MCAGDPHRPHGRRAARPGSVSRWRTTQRRVAHHVVEHAAALQLALPEPGHVRPAVLLGRARQVGPAGGRARRAPRCSSRPALDLRREDLVLQVAVSEPGPLHQLERPASPRRRCAPAASRRRCPRASPCPRSIASTISSTFSMRAWFGPQSQSASIAGSATISAMESYALRVADVELPRERRGRRGVRRLGAPDAEHVGVAHRRRRPACGSGR